MVKKNLDPGDALYFSRSPLPGWQHVGLYAYRRSFLLDGRGVIRFCPDGYGGDDAPPPDLFSTQRGNLAAASIRRRARPHDGRLWIELK